MKNYSYIGISFIILLFTIYVINSCDRTRGKNDLVKLSEAPKFEFTNQFGNTISNDNYKGKVYVLEFFFSKCPTICVQMNQNMVKLQDTFAMNANFGIVSITIDPENDTPEKLKEHAELIGVKTKNWNMLTGDKKTIYELASKFNLLAQENAASPGGFEHSGLFALVDKNGNIRCRKDEHGNPIMYYDGTSDKEIEFLKEDIKLLLKE